MGALKTYEQLCGRLIKASVENRLDEELKGVKRAPDFDPRQIDCLIRPQTKAPVIRLSECGCAQDEKAKCLGCCDYGAIGLDRGGNAVIDGAACTGCAACIDLCESKNLAERKDVLPVLELLKRRDSPVYAMIAPAFIGQFYGGVTPGKLRSAFKALGFSGMLEVALFADILTLKEALTFDRLVRTERDFMLTSCCCPLWIAMIRKIYHLLIPRLPPSVSPMAACGRVVKKLHPDAKTVFIGPCIAKKAEAREKDVSDAVDHVLTFQEIAEVFSAAGIDPSGLPDDARDHSSAAGRRYARVGGVSEAVSETLKRLRPDRSIPLRAAQANGVAECKKLLNDVRNGDIRVNFLEGMGCPGGCVGGPKAVLGREEGTRLADRYGGEAAYETPADNPYVLELLKDLGFRSVDDLLRDESLFTRDFAGGNPGYRPPDDGPP